MPAVAQDDFQVSQQGLGDIAPVSFGRVHGHFAETDDHVERRAQFVADIGDKLLFGAPRFVRLPAQVMRQAIQLGELEMGVCQIIHCSPELELIIPTLFQSFAALSVTDFKPLPSQEQGARCQPDQPNRSPDMDDGHVSQRSDMR